MENNTVVTNMGEEEIRYCRCIRKWSENGTCGNCNLPIKGDEVIDYSKWRAGKPPKELVASTPSPVSGEQSTDENLARNILNNHLTNAGKTDYHNYDFLLPAFIEYCKTKTVSGEKVYRWVKASERMPEKDITTIIKNISDPVWKAIVFSIDFTPHPENIFNTPLDNIEWLEEVSLPVKADEWISIKDQSPEESISFIAFTGGLILLLRRQGDKYYTSEGILWVNEVDFWMAKPKPPIPTKTTFIR